MRVRTKLLMAVLLSAAIALGGCFGLKPTGVSSTTTLAVTLLNLETTEEPFIMSGPGGAACTLETGKSCNVTFSEVRAGDSFSFTSRPVRGGPTQSVRCTFTGTVYVFRDPAVFQGKYTGLACSDNW